ncbi:MAG: hypothetical protein JJE52_09825 [Acidimicrobiia bacterium]|nr:hypothetical protein [Acidimicrobiia bacterium]
MEPPSGAVFVGSADTDAVRLATGWTDRGVAGAREALCIGIPAVGWGPVGGRPAMGSW